LTHLRQGERATKHRKSDCKKGDHLFGATQSVGAGIARRVCEVCGAVTIDLTTAYEMSEPTGTPRSRLGSRGRRRS
jgi:hypothetical protein